MLWANDLERAEDMHFTSKGPWKGEDMHFTGKWPWKSWGHAFYSPLSRSVHGFGQTNDLSEIRHVKYSKWL